ncbi:MAG: O-antigen ligase family protein, partial [Candidatus Spyradosoma sp.]
MSELDVDFGNMHFFSSVQNFFSWRSLFAFAYFWSVAVYVKPVWNVASAGLIALGALWCWREFRSAGFSGSSKPRGETLAFWCMIAGAWMLPVAVFAIQRAMGIHGDFEEFRTMKIFLTAFASAWVAYRLSVRGVAVGAAAFGCALLFLCAQEMSENDFGRVMLGKNPNWIANYGVWLAFALFFLSDIAFARGRRKIALMFIAGFSGCALMVAASGSRTGLLALIVGLGISAFFGGNGLGSRTRAASAVALTLFAAWILPNGGLSRAESVVEEQGGTTTVFEVSREMTNGRFEIWRECLARCENNDLWIGGGGKSLDFELNGGYRVCVENGNVHNVLLARWCEYGALGVAGALLMIFSNAVAGVVGIFRSAKMRSTGASDEGRRELWAAGAWNVALSVALFSAGMFEVVPCGR